MHRSGTSAFTRAVNLLGVPVGPDSALKGASEVNARGFWELKPLTSFNERLLERFGGGWAGPPEGPWLENEPDERARLREEAAAALDEVLGDHSTWVWKDPRNCVLLSFWLEVLQAPPVILLAHRNPVEIANSLKKRDGFPTQLGLAIWERYLRDALRDARGLPALVQRYDDILSEPEGTHREQAAFLARQGVIEPPSGSSDALDRFLDPELRHSSVGAEDFLAEGEATESQRALFTALEELRGEHAALPAVDLPPMDPETTLLLATVGRLQSQRGLLAREVKELRIESKRLRKKTQAA